jgi:hypothetical protein
VSDPAGPEPAADERLFTLEEATAMLPELRDLLPRLRQARRDLIEASGRVTAKVAADGGGVAEPAWFHAQQQMKLDLTALADAGILLRDPEIGLVDFPSIRDGERVYLCWHLDEDAIGFFHGERAGLSGRRPL